jgi:hypothetical protein
MKTYHIIDKYALDNAIGELLHYTFEEVKNGFEPDVEEFPEEHKKWSETENIDDLREYLKYFYEGDEVPYSFEEDEVDSYEAMKRANEYFRTCHYD